MRRSSHHLPSILRRVKGVVARQRYQQASQEPGLRVVCDSKEALLDIVAVHGLNEQGFASWANTDTESSTASLWLESLLGSDFPRARILTYTYEVGRDDHRLRDLDALSSSAVNLTEILAEDRQQTGADRRPLFFVAHSLGGWIVKRALVLSLESDSPAIRNLEGSSCGVVFFGTISPSRRSSPSNVANVIRRTTSLTESDKNRQKSPISDLQDGDFEWLERQMEVFKGITANLPILSFYETQETGEGFIAEQQHSMKGSDGKQIALSANHMDLIKFHGRDSNYELFINNFSIMAGEDAIDKLLESKRRLFGSSSKHGINYGEREYSLPYDLFDDPETIVFRCDSLQQLHAILQSEQKDPSFRIAHIWGKEGNGKTTLAKHYAKLHKAKLSFVFWVRAESWSTVVASYVEFANTVVQYYAKTHGVSEVESDLGLTGITDMMKASSAMQLDSSRVKSVVRAINDWLMRPGNDRWLLVVDHIEPSYDCHNLIPLTLSGRIILTSRERNTCRWGTKINIDQLTDSEATLLLYSGADTADTEQEKAAANRLVKKLDFHASSIANAATRIRSRGMKIREYEAASEQTSSPTLFGSTIDQSPLTGVILRVSSMLSTAAIPAVIFGLQWSTGNIPTQFKIDMQSVSGLQDESQLQLALQHLTNFNFIQPTSPPAEALSYQSSRPSSPTTGDSVVEYFLVDTDVRKHVRDTFSSNEQIKNAWLACNTCVNSINKSDSNTRSLGEIHEFNRIILPHAKSCYDDWSKILGDSSKQQEVAWHVLGNVCMSQGALDQAIGCFQLSLQQDNIVEDVERIQVSVSLAQLLEQQGQTEESMDVLTSLDMESIDKALGFRVALAKASAAVSLGEYDNAEYQFEELEKEQEQVLGIAHAETVGTVQMLAATLDRIGKSEEAQSLYQRVYLSYRNTFGHGHPMTLGSLDDLANISMKIYAVDEAESLYKESIQIKTRCLGADHPRTAYAIQKLAAVDDLRRRHIEARSKYQKALDIMLPTLGRAHPHYTSTMENLASSLLWHGHRLEEESDVQHAIARSISKKSRTQGKNSSASRSENTDQVMRDAARTMAFTDAEKLLLDSLAIKKGAREIYTDEHLEQTATLLYKMYDSEPFFAACRDNKMTALTELLREARRRGTM